MIDTGVIKGKIIDFALQGKLTKQYSEDSDVKQLLTNIAQKKNIVVTLSETEQPYCIPANWCWIKLGWVMDIDRGGSPRPIKAFITTKPDGINWIKIGDVAKDGKYITETKEKIKPEGEKKSRRVFPGDFLLTNSMSYGRPYISKIEGCIHDGWLVLRNTEEVFDLDFLYYLLSSTYAFSQFSKKASGSTVDNLNKEKVGDAIVPLPPIEEQRRIVTAIEKITPALTTIDNLQTRYAADRDVLKGKLIDAAICGKLTNQLPEDGTAEDLYQQIQEEKKRLEKEGKIKKSKKLPEITEDEIPFDIPANWKWARWGNLSESIQYGYNAPAKAEGRIKMVRISDIQDNKVMWNTVPYCDIEEEDIENYLLHENDILFARTGGTVGKSYIVTDIPEDSIYAGYLIRTSYSSSLCPKYMKHFMESKLYWKQLSNGTIATAQPNCNGQTLSKMILPLPPLNEQERIVNRLDSLLDNLTE